MRAKKNIAEAESYNSETFISFSCKISNPLTRSKTVRNNAKCVPISKLVS
jgi:hypothetical protein